MVNPTDTKQLENPFLGNGNYLTTENHHLHSTWLSNAVVFEISSNSGFTVLCKLG